MTAATRESMWVDIGPIDAIPLRGARVVKSPVGCIAVFRTAAGEAFAIDDACPHKAGPLSQGIVHGKAVTCPLHNWVISLESGSAQGADEGSVRTYPLTIEAGRILLDLSSLSPSHVSDGERARRAGATANGVSGGRKHDAATVD